MQASDDGNTCSLTNSPAVSCSLALAVQKQFLTHIPVSRAPCRSGRTQGAQRVARGLAS